MAPSEKQPPASTKLLGEFHYSPLRFTNLSQELKQFQTPVFLQLPAKDRFHAIHKHLLQKIQTAPSAAFLLPAVAQYLHQANEKKILPDPLSLSSFEFWLNNFSQLTENEQLNARGKIAGKFIPRDDYQVFFPIGMGKTFGGSHLVTAHLSPDVDTMVASFFGWLDAFAAKVGTAIHTWCLPGGPPSSPVTELFKEAFHPSLFQGTARTTSTLTLSAQDLLTQHNMEIKKGSVQSFSTNEEDAEKAIVVVDEKGYYLGDWQSSDTDRIRQVTLPFKASLHWFKSLFQTRLIAFFGKAKLEDQDFAALFSSIFDQTFSDCPAIADLPEKQKTDLAVFFKELLQLPSGLNASLKDLSASLSTLGIEQLKEFEHHVQHLKAADFAANRSLAFTKIDELLQSVDTAALKIRGFVDRLDTHLRIKQDVLKLPNITLTLKTEADDIKLKMKHAPYLTVLSSDTSKERYPLGVIFAHHLRNSSLGTVSFRDFCNLDEAKVASYLSVISIIDHHKPHLKTDSTPLAIIGDAQSCNVLVAEQALLINERYSLGGMSEEEIDQQIQLLTQNNLSPKERRLLQKLWQKKLASLGNKEFFVHPDREYIEYLCYLQAIFDDTDLLNKASTRDVLCTAQLVNRLKTLTEKRECEILCFDDLPRDQTFARECASRILQNNDVYSLYHHIYQLKEKETEMGLERFIRGEPSSLLSDTKEQNGCCRVGQIKLFRSNRPCFEKYEEGLRKKWLQQATAIHRAHPEIDLHIQMISLIPSADEVFQKLKDPVTFEDEMWIWIPPTQTAAAHLSNFLNQFRPTQESSQNMKRVTLFGKDTAELSALFQENFIKLPTTYTEQDETSPFAALFYQAGSINSRKSMITPYLPKLIS